MYLNWKIVSQLDNAFLRMALCTSEGYTRTRLERAFPECFSETPLPAMCVPVSMIKQRALEIYIATNNDDEHAVQSSQAECGPACEALGIPIAFRWSPGKEVLPPEIANQLIDREFTGIGMSLTYLGESFVVVHYCEYDNLDGPRVGERLDVNLVLLQNRCYICVALAAHIDLER